MRIMIYIYLMKYTEAFYEIYQQEKEGKVKTWLCNAMIFMGLEKAQIETTFDIKKINILQYTHYNKNTRARLPVNINILSEMWRDSDRRKLARKHDG